MRVLVTRPEDDAEETAARLSALGHEAVIAPLLAIRFRDGGNVALDGVQAVLITSSNGIRALARRTPRRDIEVLAVGEHSAATARALGFARVRHANGDAPALAAFARAQLKPQAGPLVHVRGHDTRGDLAGVLEAQGFEVRSEVLYDAVAPHALPEAARASLAAGALGAALFYSPRSARIFADLVVRGGLADACRLLLALCISDAAAEGLRTLQFRDVRVARQPREDVLLALLQG